MAPFSVPRTGPYPVMLMPAVTGGAEEVGILQLDAEPLFDHRGGCEDIATPGMVLAFRIGGSGCTYTQAGRPGVAEIVHLGWRRKTP